MNYYSPLLLPPLCNKILINPEMDDVCISIRASFIRNADSYLHKYQILCTDLQGFTDEA